ncbi:hypothetical protein [Fulvivirga sp.]|uniref:hypothetical protein n=1 Tax=Fulvivirga sp. TaxID=1931237 RepID=UPI0032EDA65F
MSRLLKEDKGTSEFIANDFLFHECSDLGTIRRSLIDLHEQGLIGISNTNQHEVVRWLTINLDTATDKQKAASTFGKEFGEEWVEAKKSSKRLVQKLAPHSKIEPLRLFITIKGVKFLGEFDNIKRTNYWIRNQWWIAPITAVAIAVISSLLTWYLTTKDTKEASPTPPKIKTLQSTQ